MSWIDLLAWTDLLAWIEVLAARLDLSSLFTVSSFNHNFLRLRMPAQYPRQSPSSERMTRPGSP